MITLSDLRRHIESFPSDVWLWEGRICLVFPGKLCRNVRTWREIRQAKTVAKVTRWENSNRFQNRITCRFKMFMIQVEFLCAMWAELCQNVTKQRARWSKGTMLRRSSDEKIAKVSTEKDFPLLSDKITWELLVFSLAKFCQNLTNPGYEEGKKCCEGHRMRK
jgi:hypothetical protein